MYKRSSNGGFTVNHREFISDVVAANYGLFSYAAYALNPGVESTFPWLSSIAANFEQFQLNACSFHFVSTSADALTGTSTALGSVILSCDYNAANPPFTTKQQMENSCLTVSGKPSQDIRMPVDCRSKSGAPLQQHFVRSGSTQVNQDIRFYDVGLFQIATTGGQQTSGKATMVDPYTNTNIVGNNIGELWIEYSITFFKPVLDNDIGNKLSYFHYVNPNTVATDVNITSPLGGNSTLANSAIVSPYNGANQLYPLAAGNLAASGSAPANGSYCLKDDFGIMIQMAGAISSANELIIPAGAASGTLLIQITHLNNAGIQAAGGARITAPTLKSYYPRTLASFTPVGATVVKWFESNQAYAFGVCNPLLSAGDVVWQTSIVVCITNSAVDNVIPLVATGGLALTSGTVCDLTILQLSPLTNIVGQ